MRTEPFLRWLAKNYDPKRAQFIASTVRFKGGWEGWLQVEIAGTFLDANGVQICAREVPYPAGNGNYLTPSGQQTTDPKSAARADFFLRRRGQSSTDDTFIELKCTNQYNSTPVADAWKRFQGDLDKIARMQNANNDLNCIALLAYWGTVDFVKSNDTMTLGGIPVTQLWGNDMHTYVWRTGVKFDWMDEDQGSVLSLPKLYNLLQNEDQDDNLVIVGSSPISF